MKKQLSILVGVFFLVLPLAATAAVKLKSLYEVRLPVMSQQEDDRNAAAQEGLLQVLVRLSGDADIKDSPAIRNGLKRAAYYVQEYSYEQTNAAEANYFIRLKFDKNDIRRLLRKASVAYWGEKRPLILVWMVTAELNNDFEVMGSHTTSKLLDAFKEESKKYGLPVIFPMMDMADLNIVTAEDIATANLTTLNDATKRYAPDVLLIGKVVDNKAELNSHWLLMRNGKIWEWTLSNTNPDELFSTLLNHVRETLSKQLALRFDDAQPTKLSLRVTNIEQQEDFEQLMNVIKQLVPVMNVQLSQVSGDTVDMDLQVQGTMAAFQRNKMLNQHLALMARDETNNKLVYEWKH